jgi:hypothetical protein
MKQFFLALVLIVASGLSRAQNFSEISTGIILSPFLSATKLLEMSAVTTLKGVQSTRALVQARGVAGVEQLRDELLTLIEAMVTGRIKSIEEVQGPGLRELFEQIMSDEGQKEEIFHTVKEGSDLHRVTTAIVFVLMLE